MTRHTERESATVTLVTVVESSHFMCSETHSDSEVSLVIKPFPLASPHQGAASRGNRVKIIDEDVSRSIFILMHRDILVNVEKSINVAVEMGLKSILLLPLEDVLQHHIPNLSEYLND